MAATLRLHRQDRRPDSGTKARTGVRIASIVAFLASDEASYVSGSSYTVHGGRTAA